ncbi:hypothetical protein BDF20DRAFT_814284 [Mycotypha africana]|uniref:uncharacterized protein n=1 Tax=Mycotypha africana TaxID=64632 RepID=UPI0022FFF86A|nr:uncharacterized protein BDF20DRAFT_814284 [Mycotypha africana]KAI8988167.1 hypothetical protein BDF20DRAFT_814284 [Mycotypha africana]
MSTTKIVAAAIRINTQFSKKPGISAQYLFSRNISSTIKARCNTNFVQKANISRAATVEAPYPKNYTINPYTEAKSSIKAQAKLVGKIVGYTALSVSAALALIWQMTHWYIEYFVESTPAELGYQGRNLLHGAFIRENLAIDYQVATVYLREALHIALNEKQLDESSKTIIDLRLRLANDEAHAGNLLDSITEYTRAWKLLIDKQEISITTIATAQHIGELYLRIGDYERAEEFLVWALHHSTINSNSSDEDSDINTLKSKITLVLGSLYALQKNYDLALPLLTQTLQSVPEESICLKAIVQNQLSEVLFGLGKVEDAMGWAQSALALSATNIEKQDCIECGGVAANNLGSILELRGEFKQAIEYYSQAVQYGAAIHDNASQLRYTVNMERAKEKLKNDE